jgi:hypothetical protein
MMVGPLRAVECCKKIAMPVLSDASATMLLLRDRNRMRRIFFDTHSRRFFNHGVGSGNLIMALQTDAPSRYLAENPACRLRSLIATQRVTRAPFQSA